MLIVTYLRNPKRTFARRSRIIRDKLIWTDDVDSGGRGGLALSENSQATLAFQQGFGLATGARQRGEGRRGGGRRMGVNNGKAKGVMCIS